MLFPWNHNLHALKIDFVPLQNDSSGYFLCPDIMSDKRLVFFDIVQRPILLCSSVNA